MNTPDEPLIQFIPSRIRRAVRRKSAERYILLTLISFAVSVSGTRLFLELTGYPKLGNSELHIAHVLWGGLLLFIATLIPLLFANRWAYSTSAILGGVGVGLFIDEVGKFITQSNNYFYPAAAPIIYALFLLTVLLYTRIRRRSPNREVRSELYFIFDELQEVLDHDLNAWERDEIMERLKYVSDHTDDPNLTRLVASLGDFIRSDQISLAPDKPGVVDRLGRRLRVFQKRTIKRLRLKAALIVGLGCLGALTLSGPITTAIAASIPGRLDPYLANLVQRGLVGGRFGLNSLLLHNGLSLAMGIVMVTASVLLTARREKQAINLAYLGLVFNLTIADLLDFYFDQFSTILLAGIQLLLLLGVLYYRQYFMDQR